MTTQDIQMATNILTEVFSHFSAQEQLEFIKCSPVLYGIYEMGKNDNPNGEHSFKEQDNDIMSMNNKNAYFKKKAQESLNGYDSDIFYHMSQETEDSYKEGFIDGAVMINDEDIEKAWDWMSKRIKLIGSPMELYQSFRKYMHTFKEDELD